MSSMVALRLAKENLLSRQTQGENAASYETLRLPLYVHQSIGPESNHT